MCSPEGRKLLAVISHYLDLWKESFPPGKEADGARAQSQHGWFVVAFSPAYPDLDGQAEDGAPSDMASSGDAGAAGGAADREVVWAHIGMQSLGPIEPGLTLMKSDNAITDDLVLLRAVGRYYSEVSFFSMLIDNFSTKCAIDVRFFRLVATEAMVADFRPGRQEARSCTDLRRCWPGEDAWREAESFVRRCATHR